MVRSRLAPAFAFCDSHQVIPGLVRTGVVAIIAYLIHVHFVDRGGRKRAREERERDEREAELQAMHERRAQELATQDHKSEIEKLKEAKAVCSSVCPSLILGPPSGGATLCTAMHLFKSKLKLAPV